jgi:hypothetical protein
MDEVPAYVALLCVTTIYALILFAWLKRRYEPDLTWLEVVIGVLLCMAVPVWLARQGRTYTWQEYEARVFIAFIVGGFPIIAGATLHSRHAADAAISEARSLMKDQEHGDHTEEVAP